MGATARGGGAAQAPSPEGKGEGSHEALLPGDAQQERVPLVGRSAGTPPALGGAHGAPGGARGRRGPEEDKLSAPRPPPARGAGGGGRAGPGSGGDARSGWGRRRPSLRGSSSSLGPAPARRPPAPPAPARPRVGVCGAALRRPASHLRTRPRSAPPPAAPSPARGARPPPPPPPPRPRAPARRRRCPGCPAGPGPAARRAAPSPSRSGSYLPACFRQPFPLRAPHPPPPRDRDPERAPRTAAAAGPATPPPPRTRPGPAPRPTHCIRWAVRLPLIAPTTNRPAPGVSLLSGRSVLSIRPIGWTFPGKPLPARGVPVAVEDAAGSPGSLSLPLPGDSGSRGGSGLASSGCSAREPAGPGARASLRAVGGGARLRKAPPLPLPPADAPPPRSAPPRPLARVPGQPVPAVARPRCLSQDEAAEQNLRETLSLGEPAPEGEASQVCFPPGFTFVAFPSEYSSVHRTHAPCKPRHSPKVPGLGFGSPGNTWRDWARPRPRGGAGRRRAPSGLRGDGTTPARQGPLWGSRAGPRYLGRGLSVPLEHGLAGLAG
ncbi:basic proline-rich protein-like [Muntiacus reevesi]|uniref:basic proline-rich protein-like n=1 Tax=Muntiacus reevesi TaxID=9886 RepID=UPI003306DDEC